MTFIAFLSDQIKIMLEEPEWMLWVFLFFAFVGLWLIRRRANKRNAEERRLIDKHGYIRSSDMPDITPIVEQARRRAILSVVIVLAILIFLTISELNDFLWRSI
jgi:hypothetical protein